MADRLADCAASLAWLCPGTSLLTALATDEPAVFHDDPATVLLMLRFARPTPAINELSLLPPSFRQSSILEAAASFLKQPGWRAESEIADVLALSRTTAEKAANLAAVSKNIPVHAARAAGLLAPLGWLALAVVDPSAVDACRDHDDFATDPVKVERELFGLSVDAITRRLCHKWKLPGWLANTISTLRLPLTDAAKLGADPALSKILRFALADNEFGLLGSRLMLAPPASEEVWESIAQRPLRRVHSDDPRSLPLLPHLLTVAAKALRSSGQARITELEAKIDTLQTTLADARGEFESQLHEAKLDALAEFAAGAGHEINNPLAVIRGNAQWLDARVEEDDDHNAIATIVRQTDRVADLLKDLMQFARPATAKPARFAVNDLLQIVEKDTNAVAAVKAVSLRVSTSDAWIDADPQQIRKTLGNLVRNAIDATPTGGVVRVFARLKPNTVDVIVEDTGPGPDAESVPHLFDPFYSGRDAGRGRGLGLSTAWRYARHNHGHVKYHRDSGLTQFVLSLPLADRQVVRKSA